MMFQEQRSQSMVEALSNNPHLSLYLDELERSGVSPPDYLVQLSRELRYLDRVNIIYPIGDPFFIHVYTDEGGGRNIYRVVQPEVPKDAWSCMESIEDALAVRLMDVEPPRNRDEQIEILTRLLDEILMIDESLDMTEHISVKRRGVIWRVRVNPILAEAIRHVVLMEKAAMGIIEPLIKDPYIEDISCPGLGPIFVEHKVFGSCTTSIELRDEEELNQLVYRISVKAGRPVNVRSPISDAMLPDGSRINIVYGSDVSRRGSNFTIRKFSDVPISITQLIKWNTISAKAAAYLWLLLENNLNVWFVGETASGKTTLLRAAAVFIRPDAKIVSIEDVPEIVVPHDNWVCEVTRRGQKEGEGVELFDLLKAALRQRPNYILVGEIRGAEAAIAFQAMQCVEDAYIMTSNGICLISELYDELRIHGEKVTNLGRMVRPSEELMVYSTSPNTNEVRLSECVALTKRQCDQSIRIEASDGLSLRVSPNHRFIINTDNGEMEVEASELLDSWRRGIRGIKLATRRLARSTLRMNTETLSISTGSPDVWWMIGRLLGGDYIQNRRGRYEWHLSADNEDSHRRMAELLRSLGWIGREDRNRDNHYIFRSIPERLVHWILMKGLAIPVDDYIIGAPWGLRHGYIAPYLRGVLDASRALTRYSSIPTSLTDELNIELKLLISKIHGKDHDESINNAANDYFSLLEKIDEAYSGINHEYQEERREGLECVNYLRCNIPDAGIIAAKCWLSGSRPHVYFGYKHTYIYLPENNDVYVTNVEPGGSTTVYDLVLNGDEYYIGGSPSIHPLMDTGHGVLSTFHAGSVQKLIQRLTGSPIEIPKTYIDNLNAVAIQSAVRHPRTGRLERRVISINEILGLEPETGSINFVEVFSWNPSSDIHEFRGEGTSVLLEDKVAKMRGLSSREVRKIYGELNRRAEFLQSLTGMGILSYRKVYQAVSAAYKFGLEEAERIVSENLEPDEA